MYTLLFDIFSTWPPNITVNAKGVTATLPSVHLFPLNTPQTALMLLCKYRVNSRALPATTRSSSDLSSPTKDGTHTLAEGLWHFHPGTTREVPALLSFKLTKEKDFNVNIFKCCLH